MRDRIMNTLNKINLPDGGTLVSRDMIRALQTENGHVQFVIEVPNSELGKAIEPLQPQIQSVLTNLDGVEKVSIVLTAHTSAQPTKAPPPLKVGGHPKPQSGPMKPPGVDRIIAIASGKGGVGKSTVSSNLAVALAAEGRRVGLLDADIYGPSQPRMMGINKRPASPDGKTILPLHAHGVTLMSIGFMLEENKAVVWRGPMLMGALQQMISQVAWGELDILLVDLPPGTGDVQLTLCQKTQVTGAIVVSTPQDVALLDARKAMDMFNTLNTPILGLVENMSVFQCPHCGETSDIFGHGGVETEAKDRGLPFLGALPLDLATRLAGDDGRPVALGEGAVAKAYAQLAKGLIQGGMA